MASSESLAILHMARIVPKIELRQIAMQMLFSYVVIYTVDTPLENRKISFQKRRLSAAPNLHAPLVTSFPSSKRVARNRPGAALFLTPEPPWLWKVLPCPVIHRKMRCAFCPGWLRQQPISLVGCSWETIVSIKPDEAGVYTFQQKVWVTDSNCGSKGMSRAHRDCAIKCVKLGARWALVSSADKQMYVVDAVDAETVRDRAGDEITVRGVVAKDGNTVRLISAEKSPPW